MRFVSRWVLILLFFCVFVVVLLFDYYSRIGCLIDIPWYMAEEMVRREAADAVKIFVVVFSVVIGSLFIVKQLFRRCYIGGYDA